MTALISQYLKHPQTNVNPSLSIGRSDQEAIDVER